MEVWAAIFITVVIVGMVAFISLGCLHYYLYLENTYGKKQ